MGCKTTEFKTIAKNCEMCGEPLVLKQAEHIVRKRFCSATCRRAGHRGVGYGANHFREARKCAKCGIDFIARSKSSEHCSRTCSSATAKKKYRTINYTLERHVKLLVGMSGYDRKMLSEAFVLALYEKQNGLCALTGLQMTWVTGKGHVATNLSIDRISSFRGYSPDNVQLVCRVANVMKGRMSDAEFVDMCRRVIEKAGAGK